MAKDISIQKEGNILQEKNNYLFCLYMMKKWRHILVNFTLVIISLTFIFWQNGALNLANGTGSLTDIELIYLLKSTDENDSIAALIAEIEKRELIFFKYIYQDKSGSVYELVEQDSSDKQLRAKYLLYKQSIADQLSSGEKDILNFELRKNVEIVIPYIISIIEAKYPLKLSEINMQDKINDEGPDSEIKDRIAQTLIKYYEDNCAGDSRHSYPGTYISTIKISDSLYTIYLVLLKHYPTQAINSKVLFYDNLKNEFINYEYDFNLFALYEYENGKLKPTDLKTDFGINIPEIELVDFDKNGIDDYKFTRLFHNGTFNAIQTTILSISDNSIDTLLNTLE
jgi:hypothetical protein